MPIVANTKPSPPKRTRRPARAAGILFVGAGLTAFGCFIFNYQPLTLTSGASSADQSIQCHVGGTLSYGFTITNDGSVGVTIGSIGLKEANSLGPVVLGIQMAETEDPSLYEFSPTYGVPFRPFSLAARHHHYVVVTERVRHCDVASQILSSQVIGFSVLGVQRKTALSLPATVRVGPK